MSQHETRKCHGAYYRYSWTTGYVKVLQKQCIKTDAQALAYALYLANHDQEDEAEEFLDRFCA